MILNQEGNNFCSNVVILPFSILILVTGPVPSCVKHQFEATVHLSFREQFEIIQNQARLEAIAEECENPMQIVTLAQITPRDITLET